MMPPAPDAIASNALLHGLPELSIDEGLMLAGMAGTLVWDLSD